MMEEHGKTAKIEINTFPGAAKLVEILGEPIYQDGLKPAVIQVGRSLQTVGRLVNAILSPISLSVYAIEQIEDVLKDGVSRRIHSWGTKSEDLVDPPAYVAVPAIQALLYTASNAELREMFLNLIASSMVASRMNNVHPSFVDVLRQISPDEGRILSLYSEKRLLDLWSIEIKRHRRTAEGAGYFENDSTFHRLSLIGKDAGCEIPERVPMYVDNLLRLGLIYEGRPWPSQVNSVESFRDPKEDKRSPTPGFCYAGQRIGELADQHPEIEAIVAEFNVGDHLKLYRQEIRLTEYGKAFCLACVAMEDPNGVLALGTQGEHVLDNHVIL